MSDPDGSQSHYERSISAANGCLNRLFNSCEEDPKGSVHRAWGVSLIFIVLYFILSIVEMVNLRSQGGSSALVIAAVCSGVVHLILGILGTFVLKRFPTSFSIGFFLGVLVVLANQNLILFGTFHGYTYGTIATNNAFANLCLALFAVLAFFALILFHFKRHIVIAPIDAKGMSEQSVDGKESTDYQQHEDQS